MYVFFDADTCAKIYILCHVYAVCVQSVYEVYMYILVCR
jgi:hypothetical protein